MKHLRGFEYFLHPLYVNLPYIFMAENKIISPTPFASMCVFNMNMQYEKKDACSILVLFTALCTGGLTGGI